MDAARAGARDISKGEHGLVFPDPPAAAIERDRDLAPADPGGPLHARALEHNPDIPAGFAFWGQVLARDVTHDHAPLAREKAAPGPRDFRAPRPNLEALCGQALTAQPYVCDARDTAKLRLGRDDEGAALDLQRDARGRAIVGDPRDDTDLFLSPLHLALARMHDAVVDRLREDTAGEVVRPMRWHCQGMVLREYPPRMAGEDLARKVREGEPLERIPGEGFVPLECAAGVIRMGHAPLRSTCDVDSAVRGIPDLAGQRPVPASRMVGQRLLFQLPSAASPQPSGRASGRAMPTRCSARLRASRAPSRARARPFAPPRPAPRRLARRALRRGRGPRSGGGVAEA